MATHAHGRSAADVAAPRALHNAALLTAASLAAKGCGFALLLVAARVLGKDGFGEYNQVMAVVGLFAVATDLGLSTLAVRDVAQERALLPRYVGNVLALRLLLAFVAAVACITLAVALRYSATVRVGIVLWALALVPVAVVGTMGIVFQSIERMATLSALTASTAALTAVLGVAAVLGGGRVVALVGVAAAVNTAAALAALVLALRLVRVHLRVELSWWPVLLRAALPFAALALLDVLYSRADAVLVFTIKGRGDAGLYGVAYRFVDTLLATAISPFNAAALPAFNRIAAGSRAALQALVVSGVRIMLVLGVPVAVAATVYAREILTIVGGKPEYLAAVPALEWLAWSFPCFTVLAILYNALYAARRAGDVAAILGVTLVFNVGLNLLLIPHYSYFASAALTTASEALNVALAICAVRRHVGPLAAWPVAARVALAALAMALVTWALRPLGLVAGLPAGVLTYLATIRLLRTLGAPEHAILARVPLAGRYARWL
jgi:O-antigen/teichoic acid export membrane protein